LLLGKSSDNIPVDWRTPVSDDTLNAHSWPPEGENAEKAGEKEMGGWVLLSLALLANLLTSLLRFIRYAYLLRVQIVIAAVLFVFPFGALVQHSPLRALFQNLFLMDGGAAMWAWPTFWSTMAALILAWSILLTSRIVLLNCGDRFNVPSCMMAADLRGWSFFVILLLALPTILGQFTQQNDFRPNQGLCGKCVLAVAVAVVCSYFLAFVALWCAVVLAPPRTQGSARTFPCLLFMQKWLEWADEHHVLPKGLSPGIWIRKNLPSGLWRGYLASDGFMWSGHWLALLFGLATLGVYFLIGWWHGKSLGEASGVSALTFVLLLLLNANWVLAFLAFFLDRFRIPLLVPLGIFALISGSARSSDHYFSIQPPPTEIKAVSPGQVLRARAGKPIVLIATAGGGIQAAAWTTQVLTGLEELCREWTSGSSFADEVTLISSVSGGATGSMFYLNLYDSALPQHFRADQLPRLTDSAAQPSLDDVAWALVYNDLPRIFFFPSGRKLEDRGYALEESWRKRAQIDGMLSQWRKGVVEGWRPAAIFNSTIDETGEPLVFSTTAWKQEQAPRTNGGVLESAHRQDFYEMYEGADLSVVTAVRLAATFPFVTPAARPATQKPDDYHMIDGGYYDNYGVSSLIAWLEEGLLDLRKDCEEKAIRSEEKQTCQKTALPHILILQIRSFPEDAETQPSKKGWAFQLYAPVKGLLSVRTTAQLLRDREALRMFASRWEPSDAETERAKIQFSTFEFGGFKGVAKDKAINPPLSWAMNPSQIQAVKDDWNTRFNQLDPNQNDPNVDKVHCFFDPSFGRCNALARKPE
jgi:Patatin-like phospholipase